jgi:hypothetical protein
MDMNGEIHASASLPPESPVTNFIGDCMGPRFCLNASGLKMQETGCSETTIPAYEIIQCHKKQPYLNCVYPLDI